MRVLMFAAVVSALAGSVPARSEAQTAEPRPRGRAEDVIIQQRRGGDRDRARREAEARRRNDGNWDWRRNDSRRDNGRWDDRRDRRDDRISQKRARELAKRVDKCEREMWRSSRYSRNDRYGRYDRRDVLRERERIERLCERQVYGRGRW
jgi:hypothetical protein